MLVGALKSGAAPSLRIFDIRALDLRDEEWEDNNDEMDTQLEEGRLLDEDVEALAAMLEVRARRPACRQLEMLQTHMKHLAGCSEGARYRLVRAMLGLGAQ